MLGFVVTHLPVCAASNGVVQLLIVFSLPFAGQGRSWVRTCRSVDMLTDQYVHSRPIFYFLSSEFHVSHSAKPYARVSAIALASVCYLYIHD